MLLYADDTTLVSTLETFRSQTNINNMENSINIEIQNITNWLYYHKLHLNTAKSKTMILYNHLKNILEISIKINTSTERVQEFKFMCISLDQHLTWQPHINKIYLKISRVIGLLRKLKRSFSQRILRNIILI